MRLGLLLFLLLAGCAADAPLIGDDPVFVDAEPTPPPAPSESGYFPPDFAHTQVACDSLGAGSRIEILNDFQQNWYSRHLEAAGEPSLYGLSETPRPAGAETLRFTWLRSFHAPVIVRVETDGAGRGRLIAKQLSGAGGYSPGKEGLTVDRALNPAEAGRLASALGRSRLFTLPPRTCDMGLDGSQWIFEAVDGGGYHFLDRWTPKDGAARDVGELLLGLTGWKLDPIY